MQSQTVALQVYINPFDWYARSLAKFFLGSTVSF